MSLPAPPATIGLDWGTTNLRAFLIAADGSVLAERGSGDGLLGLDLAPGLPAAERDARFERALLALAGDWLDRHADARPIACGMVGSAQGWREAPYIDLPADPLSLATALAPVPLPNGRRLAIVPGLKRTAGATPDVMRGEETQIVGALPTLAGLGEAAWLVLPGTHSKWVRLEAGRVTDFHTYMTGELYALLASRSILQRLLDDEPAADADVGEGFDEGVDLARDSGPGDLSRQLFAVRTLGLVRRHAGARLRQLLSGLLIGHEIVSGLALGGARSGQGSGPGTGAALMPRAVVLVGSAALCRRYAHALARLGMPDVRRLDNPAAAGLHRLAWIAG